MLKIVTKGAKSNLPFSPAIIAGDIMFISGQASVDPDGGAIISGTFEEEMRRSIENLRSILVAEGLSLDNVINVKSYVAEQSDLPLYNKIYADYFNAPLPTRSTIMGVLGTMLKFELDAIACVSTTRQQAS